MESAEISVDLQEHQWGTLRIVNCFLGIFGQLGWILRPADAFRCRWDCLGPCVLMLLPANVKTSSQNAKTSVFTLLPDSLHVGESACR